MLAKVKVVNACFYHRRYLGSAFSFGQAKEFGAPGVLFLIEKGEWEIVRFHRVRPFGLGLEKVNLAACRAYHVGQVGVSVHASLNEHGAMAFCFVFNC